MDAQKAILVAIIIVLFVALAFELKFIEDMLIGASLTTEEQCERACSLRNETPYVMDNSCFCKEPIAFRKQLRCFANATFENDTMFSSKFNATSVRDIAVKSVVGYPAPNAQATKIFGIYNAVSKRVYYVSDPRKDEYMADPLETWDSMGGDCDDFSVLIASMYESVGMDSSIVEVYNKTQGHVFVIVRIEQDMDSFLNFYKILLEDYTPYFSERQFNFIVFGGSREECDSIENSVKSGENINSFYVVVESTAGDYPGSQDTFEGYDGQRFIKVGK